MDGNNWVEGINCEQTFVELANRELPIIDGEEPNKSSISMPEFQKADKKAKNEPRAMMGPERSKEWMHEENMEEFGVGRGLEEGGERRRPIEGKMAKMKEIERTWK
jgi:hypothetical protein